MQNSTALSWFVRLDFQFAPFPHSLSWLIRFDFIILFRCVSLVPSFACVFELISCSLLSGVFTSIELLFFLFVDYCPLDLLKITFYFHLRALMCCTAANHDRRPDQTSESVLVILFNFHFLIIVCILFSL